jgi:hypothetical protein
MIFEMIGFTRIMKIVPSLDDALKALGGEAAPA